MEENEEKLITKKCKNCINYVKYYTIIRFRLIEVNFGHCKKNLRKKPSPCENWTENKIDRIEDKIILKRILLKMVKRLDEIALLLNNID